MVYSRSALAFALLLTACPSDEPPVADTGSGTSSPTTSTPGEGSEGPCPEGSPCGSECVFLGSDPNNCGACGNVCGEGTECIGAECLDTDPCDGAPGTPCGPSCVDLDSDNNHCGECGNDCNENEYCGNGMCISRGGETTDTPPDTDSGPSTTTGDETTNGSSGDPPGTTSGGSSTGG